MLKKDLKYIEENYKIYSIGAIYNKRENRFQATQKCKAGYLRVHLTVNGKRKAYSVHRLVALKYVQGKTNHRCEVNHLDGDKCNNNYTNLEWVTRKENMHHAKFKLKRKMGKVTDKKRDAMIMWLLEKYTNKDVANLLKTTSENISRIKKKYKK